MDSSQIFICAACGLWQFSNLSHICYSCGGQLIHRFIGDNPVSFTLKDWTGETED